MNFLLTFGQARQEKNLMQQKSVHKELDIAYLWVKKIRNDSSLRKIDADSPLFKDLDISNILQYNDTTKNEKIGSFSTYIGALGKNFKRIDFLIYSANKVRNQDYVLKLLMKRGGIIDTLQGGLRLMEAFEFPGLTFDKQTALVFLYEFNFASRNPYRGLSIKGTSSVSFYVESKIAKNFWMEDGTLNEYMRTFVGYYHLDDKKKAKVRQKCIFAMEPAGLYNHLPFCDKLYYNEVNDNPDYYLIKDKYLQFGWQDYNYDEPKNTEWWRK